MLYRKYFQRKLYLAAQVDDVALVKSAQKWLEGNHYQLTYADFENLHQTLGVDLATEIIYLYLAEHQQAAFVSLLDSVPIQNFSNNKKIKFLIVPGMFYHERP